MRLHGRTPPSFVLPLVAFLLFLSLFGWVNARTVKVLAQDTPTVGGWIGPVVFDFAPKDQPGGGPNSSVCIMGEQGDSTMYTLNNGATFTYTFRGIAAQVVMTSRPDHGAVAIALDGGALAEVDTYSLAPACGVVWRTAGLALGEHTITGTAQLSSTGIYLELMSILYDDGSDIPPSVTKPSPIRTSTPVPSSQSSFSSLVTSSATFSSNTDIQSSSGSSMTTISVGTSIADASSLSTISTSSDISTASTTDTSNFTGSPDKTASSAHSVVVPVGVTVSAVCGIIILSMFVWCLRRRRQRRAVVRSAYLLPQNTASAQVMRDVKLQPESSTFDPQSPTTSGSSVYETTVAAQAPMPVHMTIAPEDIDRIAMRMHDMLAVTGERGELPPYGGSQV